MDVREPSAKYLVEPGFKQTEAGEIPADWRAVPLLTAVKVATGQVDPKQEPFRSMVLVAPDHIESQSGRLLEKRTAEAQGAISGKYVFSAGDIIYSKIRPYLRKAILADFNGLCSADMYPLTPTNEVSGGYVFHVLLAEHFSQYAESVSVRSGMPKINRDELAAYWLALPPSRAEQDQIARTLADADALIESLEQLLAKKRQIKQGAMQELLTGGRRFGSDKGAWKVAQLRAICSMQSGTGITTERIDDHSDYPCYGGNGLRGYTHTFTHDGQFALIGRQGALCGNVLLVKGKFFASEHAVVVTANPEVDIGWLSFVLRSMNLNQYAESSAQPGLSVGKLLELPCSVPSHTEQTAIAEALLAMDEELAGLETKLTKARHLKQAMMQALLTGRVRLAPQRATG